MSTMEARLEAMGLELPAPSGPAANYAPWTVADKLVLISGQVPVGPQGLEFQGQLGRDYDVDQGRAAAQLCALNVLAQLKAACDGDLSRAHRCLRLGGFINAAPGFEQHPRVMDGASDLIAEVMAGDGRHARFAVGVSSLPFNVAVEVEAIFTLR